MVIVGSNLAGLVVGQLGFYLGSLGLKEVSYGKLHLSWYLGKRQQLRQFKVILRNEHYHQHWLAFVTTCRDWSQALTFQPQHQLYIIGRACCNVFDIFGLPFKRFRCKISWYFTRSSFDVVEASKSLWCHLCLALIPNFIWICIWQRQSKLDRRSCLFNLEY